MIVVHTENVLLWCYVMGCIVLHCGKTHRLLLLIKGDLTEDDPDHDTGAVPILSLADFVPAHAQTIQHGFYS